tara:strand:- start:364 stop:840 length:477 start_codon:yes stop_codon:yes gene_type:complete
MSVLNKTLDLVKSHGIILLVSGLFIATAIYIFIYYIKPQIDKSYYTNDEFNDQDTKNKYFADIYLFSAKWCPHSKKIMKIWKVLKEKYNNQKINSYNIVFKEIEEKKNKDELDKFEEDYNKEIDGFPTIILIKDNQLIEFEAKATKDNLEEFLHSILI